MSLFGNNDYGYDYGYRGTTTPRDHQGFGRGAYGGTGGWEAGFDRGPTRYGTEYRGHGRYDRNYKSQWQTDYGDPFGDRQNRTPMRVIRGEYQAHDRGFGYGRDYSRHPMSYDPYAGGAGWSGGDSWGSRSGREGWGAEGYRGWNNDPGMDRGPDRSGRWNPGINRGYDRGWF